MLFVLLESNYLIEEFSIFKFKILLQFFLKNILKNKENNIYIYKLLFTSFLIHF